MIIAFIVVLILVLLTLKEPKEFVQARENYEILLNHVRKEPSVPKKFHVLKKRILISGFKNPFNYGALGYNINKGTEIGLCVQGDSNQIFHVLLHELAHSTVEEYSHNEEFWKNFRELCSLCERLGIYKPINTSTKFCGKYIRD
jgi:hypothetical protein